MAGKGVKTDLLAFRCRVKFSRTSPVFSRKGGDGEDGGQGRVGSALVCRATGMGGYLRSFRRSTEDKDASSAAAGRGAGKPVSIYMGLHAAALEALLRQLAEIRAQMLPALRRN